MTTIDDLKKDIRDSVRDEVKSFLEDNLDCDADCVQDKIDYSGAITELVDGSVPTYSAEIMEVAGDSEVYQHENELGPAFDGSPTPINILATSIYEILQEEAWSEIRDVLKELENDGCFDDKKTMKKCLDKL